MRLPLLALGALFVTGLAVAAEPREKFLEVSDLESIRKDPKSPPTLLDANDAEFREKNGIIPGAKLLRSSDRYDLAKELPADRNAPVIFYCSSRR
jgi:rhodanese-related sulfurtransferase